MSGVITSFNGTHFTSHDVQCTPNSIAVDHDGLIWIASDGGAVRFDGSTVTKYRYIDGFSNSGANAVVVDANNIKWFGAGGGEGRKGLYSFDGTTWRLHQGEKAEVVYEWKPKRR